MNKQAHITKHSVVVNASPHQPPHRFHTWLEDKLTTRFHFIKMKTQSIQWAGNWKSFSLELLRVLQSLPVDSTGGPGCRQPFVFKTPALPLSLQPHFTSFVYLCLSSFSRFTFPFSQHPIHLWKLFLLGHVSKTILEKTYIYIFKIYLHLISLNTALSLPRHPPQLLKALVVCLFVLLSFNFYFIFFLPHLFFSPPICLLPPHLMFSNVEKQVKTPQQNATRDTISTCSGEITVAGSGHRKLQQQNRGVLSFSFLFTLSDSGCSELIVIKMESVTLL